ncbi:hypothetical protein M422DRAFT_44072 [Sphaerobolus stellatus SS14]|nr:hypothetical protein M422DRAFT_44072 [Sphaerobolus stellatus SS14]
MPRNTQFASLSNHTRAAVALVNGRTPPETSTQLVNIRPQRTRKRTERDEEIEQENRPPLKPTRKQKKKAIEPDEDDPFISDETPDTPNPPRSWAEKRASGVFQSNTTIRGYYGPFPSGTMHRHPSSSSEEGSPIEQITGVNYNASPHSLAKGALKLSLMRRTAVAVL